MDNTEKIARYEEIYRRGIQDKLPPEKRAIAEELIKRGVLKVAAAPAPAAVDSDIPTLPTAEEKAAMAIKKQPADDMPTGDLAAAVVEPALSMATGFASQVPAGLRGIYETIKGGDVRKAVEDTESALTFQPRTKIGQKSQELVGKAIEATGAPELLRKGSEALGEFGYTHGGEGAAAALQSVPEIALNLMGVKGLRNAKGVAHGTVKTIHDVSSGIDSAIKTLAGKPEMKVYDDAGMFTKEAIDVLNKKADAGIDVDNWVSNYASRGTGMAPEEAKRMAENINLFRRRGIQPTRANITQSTTDWRMQQDAIKETGDLSKLVANQDQALAQLAREGKAKIGAEYSDYAAANNSMASVVVNIREAADKAVSNMYKEAEKKVQKKPIIALSSFSKKLKEMMPDNQRSGYLIDSIIGDLDKRGIISKDTMEPVSKLNPKTVENVRQQLNQLYADTQGDYSTAAKTSRRLIHDLKEAIDADTARDLGEDIFAPARAAKVEASKLIGRQKANKYDQFDRNLLQDISENNVPEGQIIQKIVKSNRPEEFQLIHDFYTKKSGDAGISAMQNMKAAIVEDAINKATGSAGEGGVKAFNAKAYKKVFDELRSAKAAKGKDAKTRYEVLFTPEERALIEDVEKIGSLRTPERHVPQGSGPSGKAIYSGISKLMKKMYIPEQYNIAGKMEQKAIEKQAMKLPESEIKQAIRQQEERLK